MQDGILLSQVWSIVDERISGPEVNLDEILGHRTHMDHHYESIVYQFVATVYDYLDGRDDRGDRDCDADHDHDAAIHDRFRIDRCECYDDASDDSLCFSSFLATCLKSFHFFAIAIVIDVVTVAVIDRILYDFYTIPIARRYEEDLVELMM